MRNISRKIKQWFVQLSTIEEKRSNVNTLLQNALTPMERTAATFAVFTVSIRHVIDLMDDACLVVLMAKRATQVNEFLKTY